MEKKKYYNSIEWGIETKNTKETRSDGIAFLNYIGLPIMNYKSYNQEELYNNLSSISEMLEQTMTGHIVIFDPSSPNIPRCNIPGNITGIQQVLSFIENQNLDLTKYKITFTERIMETPESYCGVVMSDGTGNTVIEILNGTSNIVALTSAGVNTDKIQCYYFYDFKDDYIVPYQISNIREKCQHYKGYYEFMYGKLNGISDVYYTSYSENSKYLNMFEKDAPKMIKRFGNIKN